MASLNRFDELNNLSKEKRTKNRSIPYEEYFGEMEISEYQKEERIGLAKALEPVFFFIFSLIYSHYKNKISYADLALVNDEMEDLPDVNIEDFIDYEDIAEMYDTTERRLLDVVDDYRDSLSEDSEMREHINKLARDIVDTTIDNIKDDYYHSEDRAKFCAEDQANDICNYEEYAEAVSSGKYKFKRWITMKDESVRKTHAAVDEVIVPILAYFTVGDSLMLYPKDDAHGASAREIIGCRCSIEYL